MARRFQEITEVYRQELAALARGDKWTAFLRSACRNYKLHFEEQVLVHAQRPDATAVLEMEHWNRRFDRWVDPGSTGIAVFDRDTPGRARLKYYFDISDTHEGRFHRPVPLWQAGDRGSAGASVWCFAPEGDAGGRHRIRYGKCRHG